MRYVRPVLMKKSRQWTEYETDRDGNSIPAYKCEIDPCGYFPFFYDTKRKLLGTPVIGRFYNPRRGEERPEGRFGDAPEDDKTFGYTFDTPLAALQAVENRNIVGEGDELHGEIE